MQVEKSKTQLKNVWSQKENLVNVNKTNVKHKNQNLSEEEIIVRDYDVEFYMKRGLTKIEAINYIRNKLAVKTLWSKMTKIN